MICEINKKMLLKWFIVCLLLLVSPYTLFIFIPIFSYLLYSRKINRLDVLLLYFLSFLIFNSLNTLGGLGNLRYILIGICFIDFFFFRISIKKVKDIFLMLLLFIFFVYILLNAIFVSFIFNHSFLQYLQFVILISFCFISTNFNNLKEFKYNFDNIYNLYIVILVMSFISILVPMISFGRNGIGFQGVTLHPNAYGAFFSGFTALAFVLCIYKKTKIDILFFLLSLILLFLSKSRTSIFSLLLGIVIYFIITPEFRRKMSKTLMFLIPVISLSLLFFYDKISAFIYSFLLKSEENSSIMNSIESSRGALIEAQLENIRENLYFGIGFKIPSNKIVQTLENSNTFKYEKGNLFLACIEELGVIGFIFFITIVILLLFNKHRYNKIFMIIPLVLFITTFGESTLFSIGGLGVFIWMMMFLNRKNNFKFI